MLTAADHAQATSYLCAAWEALAAQADVPVLALRVAFEDVSIVQAVQAEPGQDISLSVLLDRSGRFQVRSGFRVLYCRHCSVAVFDVLCRKVSLFLAHQCTVDCANRPFLELISSCSWEVSVNGAMSHCHAT